jgi:hypothetical protein
MTEHLGQSGVWRVKVRLERKWADTWIGAYWSKDETWRSGTVWICVVPCFPLKIDWWRRP